MADMEENDTERGLKVLALHGEGLQGLGIISVIDELCSRISDNDRPPKNPLPCDVFDVICGTGIGAFFAVLLGTYGLDVARCKQAYMDLADFVAEQQLKRRANTARVVPEDAQAFLEALTHGEEWHNQLLISHSSKQRKCCHVYTVRERKHRLRRSEIEVTHAGLAPNDSKPQSESANPAGKPTLVAPTMAAAITDALNSWVDVHLENGEDYFHHVRFVHGILPTIVDVIGRIPGPEVGLSLLISIGPPTEALSPTDMSRIPRKPAQWVSEKSSPIAAAMMWPIRATLKGLAAQELDERKRNSTVVQDVVPAPHPPKSPTFLQWPIHSILGAVESSEDEAERLRRSKTANQKLRELIDADSGSHLFQLNCAAPKGGDHRGDLDDLKETRSSIKDTIQIMTGLVFWTKR